MLDESCAYWAVGTDAAALTAGSHKVDQMISHTHTTKKKSCAKIKPMLTSKAFPFSFPEKKNLNQVK